MSGGKLRHFSLRAQVDLGPAGHLHANAEKQYNHASRFLSEQQWCRPALRSFTVLCSTSKSFLRIEFFVEGKSSEAQSSGSDWCIITLCSINGQCLKTTFQLRSPSINKSLIFDELHMQKNKKGGQKRAGAIREIKSYVYSVTPHIPWSSTKRSVLEEKQIACPVTRLCLFLLLSLESHEQMWALKMNVQRKTLF